MALFPKAFYLGAFLCFCVLFLSLALAFFNADQLLSMFLIGIATILANIITFCYSIIYSNTHDGQKLKSYEQLFLIIGIIVILLCGLPGYLELKEYMVATKGRHSYAVGPYDNPISHQNADFIHFTPETFASYSLGNCESNFEEHKVEDSWFCVAPMVKEDDAFFSEAKISFWAVEKEEGPLSHVVCNSSCVGRHLPVVNSYFLDAIATAKENHGLRTIDAPIFVQLIDINSYMNQNLKRSIFHFAAPFLIFSLCLLAELGFWISNYIQKNRKAEKVWVNSISKWHHLATSNEFEPIIEFKEWEWKRNASATYYGQADSSAPES